MAYVLERSLWLPEPPHAVFPFFADAANLEIITPPQMRFRIVSPLPIEMREGAEIRYRMALFGVPFGWQTEITAWQPDRRFVDLQRRGPYRRWEHLHVFEPEAGGTRMLDRVEYALPLSPLGAVVHPIVRRQLEAIFDFRAETVLARFGDPESG